MYEVFIPHLDLATSEKLIAKAKEGGYNFFGRYKNMTVSQIIEDFYKYNHGNSKILWSFYYNGIIDKWESTTTSRTIKNTYPQLKNIPITYYFG